MFALLAITAMYKTTAPNVLVLQLYCQKNRHVNTIRIIALVVNRDELQSNKHVSAPQKFNVQFAIATSGACSGIMKERSSTMSRLRVLSNVLDFLHAFKSLSSDSINENDNNNINNNKNKNNFNLMYPRN